MASPSRGKNGSYRRRKRIPDDVREDYARLYAPRLEAKISLLASTPAHVAKQLLCEWQAEVEARIAAIRALHKGEGILLTDK
jgi:hypothetical protein